MKAIAAAVAAALLLASCSGDDTEPTASVTATPPVVTATVTTTIAPAPTTTVAPPTTVAPTTTLPRPALTSVLTVGDGVMFDAEPAITTALAPARVVTGSFFGSGLSRPEQFDWETEWSRLVTTEAPEVVVVLLGVWDARDVTVDGTTLVLGSEGWEAWYRGRLQRAVEILGAGGATIVWVLPLAEGDLSKRSRLTVLDAYLRRTLQGVVMVDGDIALSGASNTFAEIDADGNRLRAMDGEHLCPEGAARVARAVRAALVPTFALEDGQVPQSAWAQEGRYYEQGDGC